MEVRTKMADPLIRQRSAWSCSALPRCLSNIRIAPSYEVVSIRNKWFKFDGTVPHAVLPFDGNRLSIVYFTLSKYLTMAYPTPSPLPSLDEMNGKSRRPFT